MELKCFAMFVELKLAWNKWNFFFFAMFVPILSDVSEETELVEHVTVQQLGDIDL
jgi:hypothetical protein